MMDMENDMLNDYFGKPPTGPNRWNHPVWGPYVKKNLHKYGKSGTRGWHLASCIWHLYIGWVAAGNGDDWFQPKEDSKDASDVNATKNAVHA